MHRRQKFDTDVVMAIVNADDYQSYQLLHFHGVLYRYDHSDVSKQ